MGIFDNLIMHLFPGKMHVYSFIHGVGSQTPWGPFTYPRWSREFKAHRISKAWLSMNIACSKVTLCSYIKATEKPSQELRINPPMNPCLSAYKTKTTALQKTKTKI